ncbi:type VI secretion system-associated protein TagO [Microvirga sp. M2]|uniref:type VI secretion system-associated protein TagO n=1 Tax=Microvirga sp. M2 TaxID=3073270 RepID=UPI0039C00775
MTCWGLVMHRYFLIGLLGLMPLSAYAQDPRTCAALSEDKVRLECYDLVHRKTAKVTNASKWQVVEEKSRLDDSREVALSVASVAAIRGKYGQEKYGTLVIICRERATHIYFAFGDHFMSSLGSAGRVSTRVDTNTPKTLPMRESNDHSALGLWERSSAIPFIKDLFGGKSLYVRAVPYNESAIELDFPIAGVEDAIKPLREACKW